MLADFFETLAGGVEQIIQTFGLPGVTLIALLENLFPPTPSELLYPLAGKLAYDGELTPWGVIAAGVAGSLAGSLIYYSLGYWLGAERARAAIVRFGHIRIGRFAFTLIAVADYDQAVALFQRRGGSIVLIARLMPLVHSVVSIPAGVTRMRLLPFIVYTGVVRAVDRAAHAGGDVVGHQLGTSVVLDGRIRICVVRLDGIGRCVYDHPAVSFASPPPIKESTLMRTIFC
jgi:membrane protein DedA with SNARE-associated domain